jgi:hypothetical protein
VTGQRPKWREIRQFCENEGFTLFRSDHDYFDKVFAGGETAGTKISRGVEGETLDPAMWHQVWKRQLRLKSEEDFWRGVRGESVVYDIPAPPAAPKPLSPHLVRYLRTVEYLDDAAIEMISEEEATTRYFRYLSRPRPDP